MGADREPRGNAHSVEFDGKLSAAAAAVARRLRTAAKDKTPPLKRERFKSNLFFVAPAKAGAQGHRMSPALGPRFRGEDSAPDPFRPLKKAARFIISSRIQRRSSRIMVTSPR